MANDPQSFDDPVLKSAIKRTCGWETAPPHLRQRIERLLADQTGIGAAAPRRRFDWRNSPLVGLAAAAMILVCIGVVYNHIRHAEPSSITTLPNDFAADMVAAHQRGAALAAFHGLEDAPPDDLNRIRQTLQNKLGHPVLVGPIGSDWEFEGARVTQVGQTPASQLLFRRGQQTVSVISVSPAGRQYVPEEGSDYRQTWTGHPIAGVVKGGIVHCVVGSKDTQLSERELARLRDRIARLLSSAQPRDGACGTHRAAVSAAASRF